MSWYSFFKYTVVRPFVKLGYHARVEGEQNIPATGGAVIAGNHTSATETYVMPALIKRQVTYPAKAELFKPGKGLKGIPQTIIAWAIKAVGQVPLDRFGGKAALDGLGPVLEVLKAGGIAGLFPEGTRSPDGRLYKGKTGVARMAIEAGVPVVPVAMINTDKVQPTGTVIPKIQRVGIRFGAPLDFSRYAGLEEDRFVLRSATDEIMYALMELSGQEYVDMYAAQMKDSLKAKKAGTTST